MTEVIYLSDDDDDVIPISATRTIGNSYNKSLLPPTVTPGALAILSSTQATPSALSSSSSMATVHIRTGGNINLASIGIPQTITYTATPFSNVQHIRNKIVPIPNGPVPSQNTPISNNAQKIGERRNSGGGIKRTSLVLTERPQRTSYTKYGSTSAGTRSETNQREYNGYYMFEATESGQPSRRSSRFQDQKKVKGKIVCTFDQSRCYAVVGGALETINHLWSHVIFDLPEVPDKRDKMHNKFLYFNSEESLTQFKTCQHCSATFQSIYKKQVHVKACHIKQDKKRSTVCNICEMDVAQQCGTSLAVHMNNKHFPGDAPYHCRKCKYRTSVRSFLFEHYVDKHSQDLSSLMCPICAYQEDLPASARRQKFIQITDFINHMKNHAKLPQYRCSSCALSFSDFEELKLHRSQDHVPLNMTWQITPRRLINDHKRMTITKEEKINELQALFFKTIEGKRIHDEITCKSTIERAGCDSSSSGSTLFECECGELKTYNGNRAASHFHRCRMSIRDVEKDKLNRTLPSSEKDDPNEVKKFCVYPPFSLTEIAKRSEAKKILKSPRNEIKIKLNEATFPPPSDLLLLNRYSTDQDMDERINKLLAKHP